MESLGGRNTIGFDPQSDRAYPIGDLRPIFTYSGPLTFVPPAGERLDRQADIGGHLAGGDQDFIVVRQGTKEGRRIEGIGLSPQESGRCPCLPVSRTPVR